MNYELMGRDGKPHGDFDTRQEALEALREEESESPGASSGWMLWAYTDDDELGECELAEDLLAEPVAPDKAVKFVIQQGERLGLFVQVQVAGSSGTATPIRRGFRRPPSDAISTHVPSEA
jgi:hypothetical protein